MYLQSGLIQDGKYSVSAGFTLPWKPWPTLVLPRQLSFYWDVGLSRWYSTEQGRRRRIGTQVVSVKPVVRLRWNGGQSRLFVEAGVGASYALNQRYKADLKNFSTRYNFASHVGAGYLFGGQYQHEALLRVEHHSNARIKHPNPGENFLQLRYALHF